MSMLDGIEERKANPDQVKGYFKKRFYDGFDYAPERLKSVFSEAAGMTAAGGFVIGLGKVASSLFHIPTGAPFGAIVWSACVGGVASLMLNGLDPVPGYIGKNPYQDGTFSLSAPFFKAVFTGLAASKLVQVAGMTSQANAGTIGGAVLLGSFAAFAAAPLTQVAGMAARGVAELYESGKDFLAPIMP